MKEQASVRTTDWKTQFVPRLTSGGERLSNAVMKGLTKSLADELDERFPDRWRTDWYPQIKNGPTYSRDFGVGPYVDGHVLHETSMRCDMTSEVATYCFFPGEHPKEVTVVCYHPIQMVHRTTGRQLIASYRDVERAIEGVFAFRRVVMIEEIGFMPEEPMLDLLVEQYFANHPPQ